MAGHTSVYGVRYTYGEVIPWGDNWAYYLDFWRLFDPPVRDIGDRRLKSGDGVMGTLGATVVTALVASFAAGLIGMVLTSVGDKPASQRTNRIITILYCGPWAVGVVALAVSVTGAVWGLWP